MDIFNHFDYRESNFKTQLNKTVSPQRDNSVFLIGRLRLQKTVLSCYTLTFIKIIFAGVLWWHSGFRIQSLQQLGSCCGTGWIPGPGISIHHRYSQKKN